MFDETKSGPAKGVKYGNKTTALQAYEDFPRKNKIGLALFKNVLKEFSTALMRTLLEGHEVILPSRLGTWQIVKYRTNKEMIDFQNSKKYGKRIPFVNLHSDGDQGRLHWNKTKANFKHKSMVGFSLTKDNKSRNEVSIARHIKRYGTSNFVGKDKITSNNKHNGQV